MKVKESVFWRWLKQYFDKYGVLYDRLEPTTCGTPDLNAIYNNKEVWIELKSESGYKIGIKPWQTRWAQKRTHAGSVCFLLVKRKTAKHDQIELFQMEDDIWKPVCVHTNNNGYNAEKLIKDIFYD